jgi:hypothetical protein
MRTIDYDEYRQLIKEHLESVGECRWCFAIDLERVPGTLVAQHDYSDGMLLQYQCSRCGGEFTVYSQGFDEPYLKERIRKLHPELGGVIDDEVFEEIIDCVCPEHLDV